MFRFYSEGSSETEQIKSNLVTLGYTNAYTNYDEAVNSFLNEYYEGCYSLKSTYDRLVGENVQTYYLVYWTSQAIDGIITKEEQGSGSSEYGDENELLESINSQTKNMMEESAESGNILNPSITDATAFLSAFYNDENYNWLIGDHKFASAPGGIIKEYKRTANGAYTLIKKYNPSKVTFTERLTNGWNNIRRLNFLKGLAGALSVAGLTVAVIQDAIEREERTGEPLTNREWAAVIISSIGLNAASTVLSGIIGSFVASIVAPEFPVANVIIGGITGCIIGYACTIILNETDLQNKLEDQLTKLLDELYPDGSEGSGQAVYVQVDGGEIPMLPGI